MYKKGGFDIIGSGVLGRSDTIIYIAICEDDEASLKILKNKVELFLEEKRILAEVSVYEKSRLLQYDIQEGRHFDLILSDIEMPDIDGMELAAYIKRYLPEVLIIFITSHLKYAIDAFELSVFRYIPKNSINSRFTQAMKDAIDMIRLQANDFYVIQMQNRMEKIPYQRILYIRREGKNSVITLTDDTVTKVRKSLSQVFEELQTEDFLYVDRGDIVNLAHIIGMKGGIVELKNGIRLPVSHAKSEEIKNRLSDFWSERI